MKQRFQELLGWAAKNERHLGAAVFLLGFVTDIFTFGGLPLAYVNYIFIVYLSIAAVSVCVTHHLYSKEHAHTLSERSAKILFPLAGQFVIGGLLSGMLVFYTRSGSVLVSWPFLIVLAFVFIGSEYFRKYKDRLVFQTFLLYLSFYAYVLFAYPYYTHTLTSWSFYISTVLTLFGGGLFFFVLRAIGKERFRKNILYIGAGCALATLIIITSYAKGILPPLPLSLREAGIYHGVVRSADSYIVFTEPHTWYERFLRPTIHVTKGEQIYAYTAVFAPVSFTTRLTHQWERYDPVTKKWAVTARIPYSIRGGRDGGYRGYSQTTATVPGTWRVSVLSESGQTLGRVTFNVVQVEMPVPLVEEAK